MTPEQISQQRVIAYVPAHMKTRIIKYVEVHTDLSMSDFIEQAIREYLQKVAPDRPRPTSRVSVADLFNRELYK